MKEGFDYQDICLVPNKCIVNSRSECDTSVQFGKFKFALPVCPANMKSVVNANTCKFLSDNNIFYVMHRYGLDIVHQLNELFFSKKLNCHSVSIGIGVEEERSLIRSLSYYQTIPDYLTIDVAHGWSDKCKDFCKFVKDTIPETFLIVGNFASPKAIHDVKNWGIDAIKVGIGGGKACITRHKTGFFVPMWTCVKECAEAAEGIPIIADGGTKEHGDIAKALAAGATMVMAGSLFAGFDQSAGDLIEIDKKLYKEYYGSASQRNKGINKNIEGTRMLIDYRGDMNRILKELKEDLQSAISYAGGKDLSALKNAEWMVNK